MRLLNKFAACIILLSSILTFHTAFAAEPIIEDIELYLINVDVQRHFSFGNWNSRQHLMLRVKAGEFDGWGETILATNNPGVKLEKYAEDMKKAIGKNPSQVLDEMGTDRKYLSWHPFEALNMALWDIKGKCEKKPSVELLGLSKKDPVNGMFCILENDPAKVSKQADIAKKEKKLFISQYYYCFVYQNFMKTTANVQKKEQTIKFVSTIMIFIRISVQRF